MTSRKSIPAKQSKMTTATLEQPERKHAPPLPETTWAMTNLMNAYSYRNMADPAFTKREWAERAQLGNPVIVSRFLKQKSVSFDNAVRLARALDLSIDEILVHPDVFKQRTLGLEPGQFEKRFLKAS